MKTLFKSLSVICLSACCCCCQTNNKMLYLDPTQPVDVRVKDLMSRMTLEQKIGQMCQYVGPEHIRESMKNMTPEQILNNDANGIYPNMTIEQIEELVRKGLIGSFLHVVTAAETNYLQSLAAQSPLKIPLLIGIDAIHGNALVKGSTVYPSPITLSSTWCDSLLTVISRQTAVEMRAMGAHWTFTPNIDIALDARWGRFGETAGEDPYLVGRMGAAQIRGFQTDDFTGEDKVIACAKHMLGGGNPINGTNAAPTDISERTMREIHLPPYLKAVKEEGVYTVMMSHNEVNGIPSHCNEHFMQEILHKEYGLQGFIVSDWMDIERLTLHGVAKNMQDAFVKSVTSGIDMHMHGPGFFEAILENVKNGTIKESRIDQACAKILEAKFRLGLFENAMVDEQEFANKVFTAEHRATALEAAQKGIILLKNENVLPLNRHKNIRKILLTGLNADNHTILGDWSNPQPEENVITIREGLEKACQERGVGFKYFNCGKIVSRYDIPDLSDEAANAARDCDLAVIVVGENTLRYLNNSTCCENRDRAGLELLNNQRDLVQKIKARNIPVIVVFVSGRPLTEEWIADHADGIVWAWEPGCMGGQAVSDILWGDINPSGKLTATIPRHVGQTKIYYNAKNLHYFHPPIDIKTTPLYEFGYGLSYTSFSYSEIELSSTSIEPGGKITASIEVSNTGKMSGQEIVQLYIKDDLAQITRPVKELKGYKRISLAPGEKRKVSFIIDTYTLSHLDKQFNRVAEQGTFQIMIGSSSRNTDLKTKELILLSSENFPSEKAFHSVHH